MSFLDCLHCFFRQEEQDGREGEPGLSDSRDSEPSGVKEGAAVDNVYVEDYEIMEGLLVEDVALDGVASTLSEVTVFFPPCSAPAILQVAPATKALRSDPPCSSETRFKPKPESIVEYCHCCGRATAAGLYLCGIPGCGHNFAPCCMRVLGPRSLKCKCHDQEIEDAQHTKALRRPKK